MRWALVLLCCVGCGGAPPRPPPPPATHFAYSVGATGEARLLALDVCFPGSPPLALVAPSSGAASRLRAARGPGGTTLAFDAHGRVSLATLPNGGCATLDVDVHPANDEPGWPRSAMVIAADAQMLPTPAWLWRPDVIAGDVQATMHVASRGDESLAVPFSCQAGGGGVDCTLDRTAFSWDGLAAIGRLERRTFSVGGGVIDVVRPQSSPLPTWDAIEAWMLSAGRASSAILGRLPAPHVLVILATTDWGAQGDPVYFGYTTRGGGAAILFVLREDATAEELVPEWVAVHELSHLALPVVPDAESWLSEGWATYEQEVLRVRAGTRAPAQALYAIAEGCGRGDRLAAGETLAATSAVVHRSHRYARVYWGGAAVMLELDLALRGAGSSLDERMRHVAERAAPSPLGWNAARVLDALDDGLPRPIAHEIAARHLASTHCLLDAPFTSLGATVGPDGAVTLSSDAAAVARRQLLFAVR